ncbi:hypothetical protein B0H13DRAFT_2540120 [Mycena leptocephala]|nr:hypothetical protein B0H13DRAFT_2540120 [Mycena leptocephala]
MARQYGAQARLLRPRWCGGTVDAPGECLWCRPARCRTKELHPRGRDVMRIMTAWNAAAMNHAKHDEYIQVKVALLQRRQAQRVELALDEGADISLLGSSAAVLHYGVLAGGCRDGSRIRAGKEVEEVRVAEKSKTWQCTHLLAINLQNFTDPSDANLSLGKPYFECNWNSFKLRRIMMRDGGHGDRVSQFVPIKWLVALSLHRLPPPAPPPCSLLQWSPLKFGPPFFKCIQDFVCNPSAILLCPTLHICGLSATPSLCQASRDFKPSNLPTLAFSNIPSLQAHKPSVKHLNISVIHDLKSSSPLSALAMIFTTQNLVNGIWTFIPSQIVFRGWRLLRFRLALPADVPQPMRSSPRTVVRNQYPAHVHFLYFLTPPPQ